MSRSFRKMARTGDVSARINFKGSARCAQQNARWQVGQRMANVLRQHQRPAVNAVNHTARPQVWHEVKFARSFAATGIVHGRISMRAGVR